ncbi:50S ribosome-binding GTPase|uniref:sulfate adenylyltransferase n=1 Tax=Dendrosporobacter quercicolus TaxID=146817 RepID=A0A1G9T5T8_9FIRM|nr:GTP-binding protein [Dendrosporobacter quercicolus]NSL48514.1 50S ribosome-binding GTPase [Dendrosporobacter quercicolus DSM 1736]SDM43084.1 bifunctional enzyme CysN/CysC [Dendrosporobacter quercicolus]
MDAAREVLNIVVVGHVDHGKSTVIGRLLYDTKSLPEGAIERVKRISREKGKPFEYAYLLDAFEEEQKQGITIDTTQLQFRTAKRDYVIIDAPGHKEFLKNMISGAASAEAALLIIDANEGIQEQSRRHGYILSLLGIQKAYVLVNKMDLIDYSEDKFNEIRHDMNEFLNSLNVFPLKYIPVSAFYGENMVDRSAKMPWYKGEALLAAIDLFEKEKGLEGKPLRFPIQDVYKFDSRRIIAGRIEAGTLKAGDTVLITPSNKTTRVKTIEYWADRDKTDTVYAGMSVGITVEDEFFNQRGEFIVHPGAAPLVADTFKANLFWMGKTELVKNREYKLKLVTQEVQCEVYAISKVIDATTLAAVENAARVNTNDVAEVIIKTKRPISFDEFRNNQITGRFVLIDGYDVSGGGIVSGPVTEIQTVSRFVDHHRQMAIHCFDDYYFLLEEGAVRRFKARPRTFKAGDIIPGAGKTYEYPASFDVLDPKAKLAAQIRNFKLEAVLPLSEYYYAAVPVVDTQGAFIKIDSADNYQKFLAELPALTGSQSRSAAIAANKWLDFGRFRVIRYSSSLTVAGADYQI